MQKNRLVTNLNARAIIRNPEYISIVDLYGGHNSRLIFQALAPDREWSRAMFPESRRHDPRWPQAIATWARGVAAGGEASIDEVWLWLGLHAGASSSPDLDALISRSFDLADPAEITVTQAAGLYGCAKSRIFQMMSEGKIAAADRRKSRDGWLIRRGAINQLGRS